MSARNRTLSLEIEAEAARAEIPSCAREANDNRSPIRKYRSEELAKTMHDYEPERDQAGAK
jgi:hypothetical protein